MRNEYYYGVFWSGMPDLNYETPAVREEAKKVATFWLRDMDVDGFRLDAIPYLMEEGSTCLSGCAGTHAFLREYSAYLSSVKPDVWTVGEAWGPIDMVMPYYPDQLTAHFGFELADSLVAAVKRGTAGGMLAGYLRMQDTLPSYRWAPFLSNHDGTRAMTMFSRDARRAKVAATLLLTLPGLPFVYYGEEIGMVGDKPDERIRTPMQWAPRQGLGFTTGKPWEAAQPDSFTTTVEAQDADSSSLLSLYRRLIHLRKTNGALANGELTQLTRRIIRASWPTCGARETVACWWWSTWVRRQWILSRSAPPRACCRVDVTTHATFSAVPMALPWRWRPMDNSLRIGRSRAR